MAVASDISRLSCHSLINRTFQLHRRPLLVPSLRSSSKPLVVLSVDERGAGTPTSGTKSIGYETGANISHVEGSNKPNPIFEEPVSEKTSDPVQELDVTQHKRAAKIHDFCFGIPYGGLVLSGGLVGFVFSRNFIALRNSVLYGGLLLGLSTSSLKVWRQGKSSLQFIVGQAVLSALLLRANVITYSLTKNLFPAGFYAVISAAMLCFYSYVVISGGNPPPKKKKLSTTSSS